MLTAVGRKKAPGDIVDRLLECHERIRSFVRLAGVAAARTDAPPEEIVDVCDRVARYFTVALPLHVRDEEESILPRLVGASSEVADALVAMHQEHQGHEPAIEALLEALAAVRDRPDELPRRAPLAECARALTDAFEQHLRLEEVVIFPAVRALPAEIKDQMVKELVSRRSESAV